MKPVLFFSLSMTSDQWKNYQNQGSTEHMQVRKKKKVSEEN